MLKLFVFFLLIATQQGNLEIVKILFDFGAKLDESQVDGWAPIHIGWFRKIFHP